PDRSKLMARVSHRHHFRCGKWHLNYLAVSKYHTHTLTLTHSLSHTHKHTHRDSDTRTHPHTHTHTHNLTHTHSQAHSQLCYTLQTATAMLNTTDCPIVQTKPAHILGAKVTSSSPDIKAVDDS